MNVATNSPEMDQLSRLRAKTDNQILDFVESKLLTAGRYTAPESLGLAQDALDEARTLLLLLDRHEKRGLDQKLNEVTEAVERVRRESAHLRQTSTRMVSHAGCCC